jgi:hypothetical protein
MGRVILIHDRDTSSINDQQWTLESYVDPCTFHDQNHCWSVNIIFYSLRLVILDFVQDLISDISISCSITLPTNLFTRYHDIASSVTELHACKLLRCNCHRVGPVVSICHADGKNYALGAHASTNSFGMPNHTILVTVLPCDGWCYQSTHRK